MSLVDDIAASVKSIIQTPFDTRAGRVVPSTSSITLKSGAVELDAVYLYADMADSTGLVRDFSSDTAAKVIKAFLDGACRVIRNKAEIVSFDGDRVMGIFVGDTKNADAARCGLQIDHVVEKIVRPQLEAGRPVLARNGYKLRHCVGIAQGKTLIVRGGVRDNNDLVSIGRAPNIAAKLSEIRNWPYTTYITEGVFDMMLSNAKYSSNGTLMWERRQRSVGGASMTVYESKWMVRP